MQPQTILQPPKAAGFPADLMEVLNQQSLDHGPYYVYPCGKSVHRVHLKDGTPHLWAGMVNLIESGGQFRTHETAAQTSNLSYVTSSGEKSWLNPEMASNKLKAMIWHDGLKGLVHVSAFDKLLPESIRLNEFNAMLALPLALDAEDHPSGLLPPMPPDIARLADDKGILFIRESHVRALRGKLVQEINGDPVKTVWLQALDEISQGFARAREWADNEVAEVETRSQLQGLQTPAYDRVDYQLMKLTGRKQKTELTPTINVNVPQQAAQAPASDGVERQPCSTCGELIAIAAKKCHYCGEWVGSPPDAEASVSEPSQTAPLRTRKTLAEKQAEMKAKRE